MAKDHKQELVEFIIHKAFDPVMRAKPDGRSEADQRKLEHLQQATQTEIGRYRSYDSAEDVVINFKRDISSSAAKKIHADLKHLHLPTVGDIRDEVEEKARALGVHGSA
jgi:hypothetical protein